MIAYRATLDVPEGTGAVHREAAVGRARRRGTARGSRALTCFWEAVLGLRWFRDRATPEALARDHGISRATAYRYVDLTSQYSHIVQKIVQPLLIGTGMSAARYPYPKIVSAF